MAKKTTEDGPVIVALKDLGYSLTAKFYQCDDGGIRNSFWLRDPHGRERHMKIQKSGPSTGDGRGQRHRHRFGIAFQAFDAVDDFVFWAKGESVLFIVPTADLLEMFKTPGKKPKILKDNQWETHIFFDERREMVPTGFGAPISLATYAHPILLRADPA